MGAVETKKKLKTVQLRMNKTLCGVCIVFKILPALSVVNSRLLLAGVTSNEALNIAVTVAL